MKPSVWTYFDKDNRVSGYRGRVLVYSGASIVEVACKNVYKNRLRALESAKQLMARLRKQKVVE